MDNYQGKEETKALNMTTVNNQEGRSIFSRLTAPTPTVLLISWTFVLSLEFAFGVGPGHISAKIFQMVEGIPMIMAMGFVTTFLFVCFASCALDILRRCESYLRNTSNVNLVLALTKEGFENLAGAFFYSATAMFFGFALLFEIFYILHEDIAPKYLLLAPDMPFIFCVFLSGLANSLLLFCLQAFFKKRWNLTIF